MALIVQTFGVVGTLTAATIAVRSYLQSNKRAQETRERELETRKAQLFNQIFNQINSKSFKEDFIETAYYWKFKDYEDFYRKYYSNPQDLVKLGNVMDTFEGIGVLIRDGLVDPQLLYRGVLQHGPLQMWRKYGAVLNEHASRVGMPSIYPNVEYLYGELSSWWETEYGVKYDPRYRVDEVSVSNG